MTRTSPLLSPTAAPSSPVTVRREAGAGRRPSGQRRVRAVYGPGAPASAGLLGRRGRVVAAVQGVPEGGVGRRGGPARHGAASRRGTTSRRGAARRPRASRRDGGVGTGGDGGDEGAGGTGGRRAVPAGRDL